MSPTSTPYSRRHRRAFGRFLRRFARARDGLAAMEFALIAPILIALYFGVTEISDALNAGIKATAVASTAADLVAQDKSICDPEMADIFTALSSIMFPYPSNDMTVVVSSLVDAGNGQVKVAWSDAYNGSPRPINSTVTVPNGLVDPGGSVIFAEVTYDYASPTGKMIYGSLTLRDKFYLHPRRVMQVSRTTGC